MAVKHIDLQFSTAKAKARELNVIALELKNMANHQYMDTINRIAASWKGKSADAYIGKADQLKYDILKTAGKLEAIAENISTTIRRTEEAEQRAKEIAILRKYQ